MTVNGHVINAAYFKKVPYDPIKSFAPIGEVAVGNFMLTVNPKIPAKNVAEFVAYAKANPGKMNFASPGIATTHHVSMEMFKLATGIDIMHVPYGGSSGAVRDLLSGNIDAMFLPIHVGMPLEHDNLIRALGVGSLERSPLAPDVLTLTEQGVAGADVDLWFALMAPAGTPDEIVNRYNAAIHDIIATPSVRDLLLKQGLVARGGTPQDLAELNARDFERWKRDLKRAGLEEP
jgi:tripartite-type tricarboxylate transporter receptor subunit TctC